MMRAEAGEENWRKHCRDLALVAIVIADEQ